MTNPIQQALAAVDEAEKRFGPLGWFHVIREALQSAAQEAEDWKAIETYCAEKCSHFMLDCEQGYDWSLVHGEPDRVSPHTRLAALSRAAEFCRKELSK